MDNIVVLFVFPAKIQIEKEHDNMITHINTKQSVERQPLEKISPTKHTYRGYTIIKNGNGSRYTIKQGRTTINKFGFISLSQATASIDELITVN